MLFFSSDDFIKNFRSFRGTLKDGASVYHCPTEMTETTERLRMVPNKDLRRAIPFFPLLRSESEKSQLSTKDKNTRNNVASENPKKSFKSLIKT